VQAEYFQRGAQSFRDLSEFEKLQFVALIRAGVMHFSLLRVARDDFGLAGRVSDVPPRMEDRVLEGIKCVCGVTKAFEIGGGRLASGG